MKIFKLNQLMSLLLTASVISPAIVIAKNEFPNQSNKADIGVINEERIEYWLKKRGELSQDATPAEIAEKIKAYVAKAGKYVEPEFISQLSEKAKVRASKILNKQNSAKVAKTVKVLAVLVDFPDLPFDNNRLTSNDTNMYYPSYPVSHFQDLIFSETGFTGPSNQNLLSAYQYYQAESGNEFFLTGSAFGWVTANSNAAIYGGNDPDNDDDDKDAPTLIKEAVEKAVASNSIDLTDYDVEDPYDFDNDGNLSEADGIIDHVMIYHSSIGEETGGGVLGEDAIWSHRFFVNQTGDVNTSGYLIPNTGKRVFGYTIQPIDAGAGVVSHEFGHDLGLPDEYETTYESKGSPVGMWSIMSGGSYGGSLSGSQPTGFSSYARSELQRDHGANWINEQVVDLDSLESPITIDLVEAVNHAANSVNQVKITLPLPQEDFRSPFTGSYQYYSSEGHSLNNTMAFDLVLPDSDNLQLTMKAHWNIEKDWDFARILINGTAISGNHTNAVNPYTGEYAGYEDANNYISDKSELIAGAEGSDFWVDLTFDVTAYKGQTVTVGFEYRTDTNTGGYGFVADDIQLLSNNTQVYFDGAESELASLSGFQRTGDKRNLAPQNYWVQLRSHNGVDSGLVSRNYDDGLVVWFSDSAFSDNDSSEHLGQGLIGVVDANQNLIGTQSTSVQIRDAAFGINGQAADTFDDSVDYSSPNQPESGILLPNNGLKIEVLAQANDSSTGTIRISKVARAAMAEFSYSVVGTTVTFTDGSVADSSLTYSWDFGDGTALSTEQNPIHSYISEGRFDVILTVVNQLGSTNTITKTITIGNPATSVFTYQIADNVLSLTNTSTGGIGNISYLWNFGDGDTSTELSPSHTYTAAGSYTLSLTVTDDVGSDTETTSITIGTVLSANFSSSVSAKTVNFTNSSQGGLGDLTYSWNFGDGNNSSEISPSHTYSGDGSYSVVLTVTDAYSNTTQVTKVVSINTQPESSGGGGSVFWMLSILAVLLTARRRR